MSGVANHYVILMVVMFQMQDQEEKLKELEEQILGAEKQGQPQDTVPTALEHLSNYSRILQTIPKYSKIFQIIPKYSKIFQNISKYFEIS